MQIGPGRKKVSVAKKRATPMAVFFSLSEADEIRRTIGLIPFSRWARPILLDKSKRPRTRARPENRVVGG